MGKHALCPKNKPINLPTLSSRFGYSLSKSDTIGYDAGNFLGGIMKFIRWFLGRIILLVDFVTTPKGVKRDPKLQAQIDEKAASLSLYQFHACPFCVKVRRAMKRNSLNIELRDAKVDGIHRQELLEQGGKVKVPCLRIDQGDKVTWLYESNDIIAFLEKEVASNAA